MAKLIKKNAFTLLELLFAAMLFSAAMVGIVAVVSSSITTVHYAQQTKHINSTVRNLNNSLTDIVSNAQCITTEDNNQLVIWDADCTNIEMTILLNGGKLTLEPKSSEKTYLTPDDIVVSNIEGKPLFSVRDKRLVSLNIKLESRADNSNIISSEYMSTYTIRGWQQ